MAGDVVVKVVSEGGIATLILAVLGVVLSLASLAWQASVFVLSGSRIRLDVRRGHLLGSMLNQFDPTDVRPPNLPDGGG